MTRRRLPFLAYLLAGAVMALTFGAVAAQAATEWTVHSRHGDQVIPPGGRGQYLIDVRNVGDTASAGPVTVVDQLPPGVEAIESGYISQGDLFGNEWSCSGATVVTCELTGSQSILPAGPKFVEAGLTNLIFITVQAPATPGNGANEVTVEGGGAPQPATDLDPTVFSSTPAGFGFTPGSFLADSFDADGALTRQAGAHPFEMRTDFELNLRFADEPLRESEGHPFLEPERQLRNLSAALPRGFMGNPLAQTRCRPAQFEIGVSIIGTACPAASQVGTAEATTNNGDRPVLVFRRIAVYNMVPPPGALAALAYNVNGVPVWITLTLDAADNYSLVASVHDLGAIVPVSASKVHLWGVPADPSHDALRLDPANLFEEPVGTPSPTALEPAPFLTMPSQCDTPVQTTVSISSWETPVSTDSASSAGATMEGCSKQALEASIDNALTTARADSPSGLAFDLEIPQEESPGGLGTPPLRTAVVRLPQGVSINPSSADGLGSCTPEQIGLGSDDPVACPDASKIGSLELETPVLEDSVEGSVYLAEPFNNPSNTLVAFYMVFEDKERGLLVKLPAKVEIDPETGQLTTTVDESPQLPFENLHVELKSGPRAPLRTPDSCGTYTTEAELTSWNSSIDPVEATSSFEVTTGPDGGPCPAGAFAPKLEAGGADPIAGGFSPFVLRLWRQDGTQRFAGLSTTLPEGLLAKLAGVPYCSQSAIDAARALSGTGQGGGELVSPACPAASQVGTVNVGAGAGSNPFYVSGKAYLAGPYKGAPLSLAIVTPAVAGPFDLGNVVVQVALKVDPASARITAVSDPLPTILHGIPLDLRDVRVNVDRSQFTLNPTSCDPMAIEGTATSTQGTVASLSDRFQVGACGALGFKPRLRLSLGGETRRTGYPKLRAVLRARPGDANIARTSVVLPHSLFVAENHLADICTRVQFAADSCPKKSVYGHARAFTPLLDKPLQGPVYLRSNGGARLLPDLVADLHGQIDIELVGYVDSVNARLRTRFATVPDAPVSRFVLDMRGGAKSLVRASENLCAAKQRAIVKMDGHNGKVHDFTPRLRVRC